MKRILTLTVLLLVPLAAPATANDDDILLFSFFRGNGEAGTYLAWSKDTLNEPTKVVCLTGSLTGKAELPIVAA